MLKIYYTIWVDGLLKMKSLPKNNGMWKFYGMTFMSTAMALNILLVMTILESHILNYHFYDVKVDVFPGTKLDAFLSFFILFLAPPLLINYLLIFYNNRYERLFKKYKYFEGKFYTSYLLISYFLPVVLLIIGKIIVEIF